jgi:hypothetical protein
MKPKMNGLSASSYSSQVISGLQGRRLLIWDQEDRQIDYVDITDRFEQPSSNYLYSWGLTTTNEIRAASLRLGSFKMTQNLFAELQQTLDFSWKTERKVQVA